VKLVSVFRVGSIVRLGLAAGLLALAALLIGQGNQPANAAHTKIFFAKVTNPPMANPAGDVVLVRNVAFMPLHIWAKDVDSSYGAGYYQVDINFLSWLLHVDSIAEGDTINGLVGSGWLGTTGRAYDCGDPIIENPPSGAGHAKLNCDAIGAPKAPPLPPPAYGPTGNGILGTLILEPGTALGVSTVTYTAASTWLRDTGVAIDNNADTVHDQIIEPADIPATETNVRVHVSRCGNVDLDPVIPSLGGGSVDIDDIFLEASKFGQSSMTPGWNPMFDMDGNNAVGVDDIFNVGLQYVSYCYPTP
jgi:hypothetical protein